MLWPHGGQTAIAKPVRIGEMLSSQSRRRRDFHDLFECNQVVPWPVDTELVSPTSPQGLSQGQLPRAAGRPKTCQDFLCTPPGTPQRHQHRRSISSGVQPGGSGAAGTPHSRVIGQSGHSPKGAAARHKRGIINSDSVEGRGLWHTPMSPTSKMLAGSKVSATAEDAIASWFPPKSPPAKRSETLRMGTGISFGSDPPRTAPGLSCSASRPSTSPRPEPPRTAPVLGCGVSRPSTSPRKVVPKAALIQDLPPHLLSYVVKLLGPGSMASMLLSSRRSFTAALDLAVIMSIQEFHGWQSDGRHKLAPMRLSAPNAILFLDRLQESMLSTRHQAVAAGPRHSLVLHHGIVLGFGSAACGQLGLGYPVREVRIPKQVAFSAPVAMVACGGDHGVMLTVDGKAWAFGHNAEGQLGTGKIGEDASSPVPVRLPSNILIVQAACGAGHSVFLSSDCAVWACGRGAEGQLGLRSLAKAKRGDANVPVPCEIEDLRGIDVCLLVCGSDTSLGIDRRGQLLVFGANASGQLGIGNREPQWRPVAVRLPDGSLAVHASCGGSHTMVVAHDGRVFGAGGNSHGQLGQKDFSDRLSFTVVTRRREVGGSAVRSVSCGFAHSLLLSRAGVVWGLGDCSLPCKCTSNSGPEGANSKEVQSPSIPLRILGGSCMRLEGIAAGGGHSICWTSAGTFMSFGGGAGGQLGCGDNVEDGEGNFGPRKIHINSSI